MDFWGMANAANTLEIKRILNEIRFDAQLNSPDVKRLQEFIDSSKRRLALCQNNTLERIDTFAEGIKSFLHEGQVSKTFQSDLDNLAFPSDLPELGELQRPLFVLYQMLKPIFRDKRNETMQVLTKIAMLADAGSDSYPEALTDTSLVSDAIELAEKRNDILNTLNNQLAVYWNSCTNPNAEMSLSSPFEFVRLNNKDSVLFAMLFVQVLKPCASLESLETRIRGILKSDIWDVLPYCKSMTSQSVINVLVERALIASNYNYIPIEVVWSKAYPNWWKQKRAEEEMAEERSIIETSIKSAIASGLLKRRFNETELGLVINESRRSQLPGRISVILYGKKISVIPIVYP